MNRKINTIFMLLLVGFIDVAHAVTSTNHNDPEVKGLEAQYIKYIEAESSGDIDAFLQTRTSEITKKIAPRLNSEMLKRMSKSELHPNEAQFVRYDSSGDKARIVYQK